MIQKSYPVLPHIGGLPRGEAAMDLYRLMPSSATRRFPSCPKHLFQLFTRNNKPRFEEIYETEQI
jgi:hypothetical protein